MCELHLCILVTLNHLYAVLHVVHYHVGCSAIPMMSQKCTCTTLRNTHLDPETKATSTTCQVHVTSPQPPSLVDEILLLLYMYNMHMIMIRESNSTTQHKGKATQHNTTIYKKLAASGVIQTQDTHLLLSYRGS